jgi:UDP-glucose 4-epimerase
VPDNLLPYITRVAVGRLPELQVFGGDYPTGDGTGVRDYIHVMDLAQGHLRALEWMAGLAGSRSSCEVFNLGTGRGYSVLEVLRAFERQSGVRIPYRIVGRRPGDIARCFANAEKAARELGWVASRSLDEMVRDAWRWQKNNPEGYP